MKRLVDMMEADAILLDLEGEDFAGVLQNGLAALSRAGLLSADLSARLGEALLAREAQGGIRIGRGVAVPHVYLDGITETRLYFCRSKKALPTDEADGLAVDLVLILCGPVEAQANHLPLLARLVRLLNRPALLDALRQASTPGDVMQVLNETESINDQR